MKLHIITGDLRGVDLHTPIEEVFPDKDDADRKVFEEGRATGMRETIGQQERIVVRADTPDGRRLEALVRAIVPLLGGEDEERLAAAHAELRAFVDGLGRRDA